MAVYTQLAQEQLERISQAFGLGPLRSFRFVPEGSINTNVLLECEKGRFFLRHTTVRQPLDLEFEAGLLDHLGQAHFPAPSMRRAGAAPYFEIAGGRACIFPYLAGEELTRRALTVSHLERLGEELGKFHRLGQSFMGDRANPYGPSVVRSWLTALLGHADQELGQIAEELLSYLERAQSLDRGLAPRGVIHADLFMDNVKWVGDRVSAFFDFEMACRDELMLDFAITLNAWCFDGGYQEELCQALVRGYMRERPPAPVEREAVYSRALFGAVRYTASRIRDFHLSSLPAEKLSKKDFRTYLARARTLNQLGADGFAELIKFPR